MLRNCLLILSIKNDIAFNKGHERHKAIKRTCQLYTPEIAGGTGM